MKKKIFAIVLALVLVFGMITFTGCGKQTVFENSDGSHMLLLDGNKFEYTVIETLGYKKTITTKSGSFKESELYFVMQNKTCKTEKYFLDTLYESRNDSNEDSFVLSKSSDDAIVCNAYNFDLMINTSKENPDIEGIYFNYYKTEIDGKTLPAFNQFYSIEWAQSDFYHNGFYVDSNKNKIDFDFATDTLTLDTSKLGITTATLTTHGKSFSFDVYIKPEHSISLSVDGLTSLVSTEITKQEYLQKITGGDLYYRNSIGELIKTVELSKDDIYIENWPTDTLDESKSIYITFCTQFEGEKYTTQFKVFFEKPGEYSTDNFSITNVNEFIHDFDDDRNSWVPFEETIYTVKKGSTDCIVHTRQYAYGDSYDDIYEEKNLNSLVDLNTTGLKKLVVDKGKKSEKTILIYVYDDPKELAIDVECSGAGLYFCSLKKDGTIDWDRTAFRIVERYLDGSSTVVENVQCEYDENKLEEEAIVSGKIIYKKTVNGKEYTFERIVHFMKEI